MSRSSVDLPDPLAPTNPVRPAPKLPVTADNAVVPSGQRKVTSVNVIDEFLGVDM
jgi:hypothetical protein